MQNPLNLSVSVKEGFSQCLEITEKAEKEILALIDKKTNYFLLAVGGLGRREQGVYSDLDLLFIIKDKDEEKEALELVKKFWDKDFKLGYSIRTIDNIFKHAREDIAFFTTLLKTRLICGNQEEYQKFKEQKKRFLMKNRGIFFNCFYPEIQKLSFFAKGKSLLLNQPNLKNSYGGLRGFQIFRWFLILYPEYRFLLKKSSYLKAKQSYFFLWSVRNRASLSNSRSIDQLGLEALEKLLESMGCKNSDTAEKLLKKVFHASSHIYDLLLELKEELDKKLPLHKRLNLFFRRKKEHSSLTIIDKKVYVQENTAVAYLEAILYAVRSDFELANSTLIQARKFFSQRRRLTPEELKVFSEFFYLESKLYIGFYTLHLVHFFSSFIPFYSKMIFRPQLDFYHSFTLDEHCILTLKHLASFYENPGSVYYKVLRELRGSELQTLIYALLLHDIGKIYQGNHIKNNIKMIDGIAAKLPIKQSQRETVSFLVIEHLLIFNTSQRKDINRSKVILSFCEEVRNIKNLTLLFLLTACDMRAVNDSAAPAFIEGSIISLYAKASIVLSDGNITVLEEEKQEMIENLKKEIGANQELLELFPEEYLVESENADVEEDLKIFLQKAPGVFLSREKDMIKIKYYGQDKEGILSRVVAGITLSQLNIAEARVYTLKNNWILDYFYCETIPRKRDLSDLDQKEIQREILRQVNSDSLVYIRRSFSNRLYYWTEKSTLKTVKTTAVFEKLEDGLVYLLVTSRDFPGILYFIADFLRQSGFSIIKSRINTIGIRIYDAFYLNSPQGFLDFSIYEKRLVQWIENNRKELLSIR